MEGSQNIIPIFPQSIYKVIAPSSLINLIPWLDKQPKIPSDDSMGYGEKSKNTYILNEPECKELKDFILNHSLLYSKILGIKCNEYKLTQSWISLKYPNQQHHRHFHSNSVLSGVFYYDTSYDPNYSQIIFFNKSGNFFLPQNNSINMPQDPEIPLNPFNSGQYHHTPSPGEIILFPSFFDHAVPLNTSNRVRKSLAFNIVPKEGLGDALSLNELKF